jgi:hypothetical protein
MPPEVWPVLEQRFVGELDGVDTTDLEPVEQPSVDQLVQDPMSLVRKFRPRRRPSHEDTALGGRDQPAERASQRLPFLRVGIVEKLQLMGDRSADSPEQLVLFRRQSAVRAAPPHLPQRVRKQRQTVTAPGVRSHLGCEATVDRYAGDPRRAFDDPHERGGVERVQPDDLGMFRTEIQQLREPGKCVGADDDEEEGGVLVRAERIDQLQKPPSSAHDTFGGKSLGLVENQDRLGVGWLAVRAECLAQQVG